MQEFEIEILVRKNGRSPFHDWMSFLDIDCANRIIKRIYRIKQGNFGDYKSISSNLYELRLSFGAGYRVYFTIQNKKVIILVNGGDKSTQKKDIKKAQELLQEVGYEKY